MSRFHVHLHVRNLEQSVKFYSTMFGAVPARVEEGYAKWMLEDPKVNFAISVGGREGVSHLGIQVDSEIELAERSARASSATDGVALVEQGARCCYATGNKTWTKDPQGVQWETFHTTGQLEEPGEGAAATFIDGVKSEELSGCGCTSTSRNVASTACCAG
jgi:catechol 2,3-dioxygenase-like lactoylglutathione lyase family enzyme